MIKATSGLNRSGKDTFGLKYLVILASLCLLVSCAGTKKLNRPVTYGNQATEETSHNTKEETKGTANNKITGDSIVKSAPKDSSDSSQSATKEQPTEPESKVEETSPKKTNNALEVHRQLANAPLMQSALDDMDASASAVDDFVWRQFDLADEYHTMGVIANREASWEEAQYYFEKSLKIMASLDVETDSTLTPEAVRYTELLDNIVSDYRVTLRSLGNLTGDVSTSVILERFGELAEKLGHDTMQVFSSETQQVKYDLPIVMNDRVKSSIVYFQTVAHEAFVKYLRRSEKYTPMMLKIIRKHGLPEDLIYLSLVESGYNPNAYSWARAMGLWQFISSTGRMYGLKRSWWIDERKDPIKSTEAACRFLKELYDKFGSWELAMAAYNGGPGRVSRTIKKQKTIDFWKMRLKRQTMDYVPLIMAATIIAKDPIKYGFEGIEKEPEIVWEEVKIKRCLDLGVIAKELGCSVKTLKTLNPELLRRYTPPDMKEYLLKIPVGSSKKFLAAYDNMPSPKETSWVRHKIRRGESISTIAARYGVSQYAILAANNLSRRSKIYAGKQLIVPVPLDRDYNSRSKKRSYSDYEANKSVYMVRSGDTMWDIARAFGTTVSSLRRSNYIERGSRIYVGQKLKIPSSARNLKGKNKGKKSSTASPKTYASTNSKSNKSRQNYKVRSGDTLWDIARKYGTTTSTIRKLNGLGRSSRIYPGQLLVVSGSGGRNHIIHKVRRGESLSKIARQYSTSIARLMANNGLTDPNDLQVGKKLKVYLK